MGTSSHRCLAIAWPCGLIVASLEPLRFFSMCYVQRACRIAMCSCLVASIPKDRVNHMDCSHRCCETRATRFASLNSGSRGPWTRSPRQASQRGRPVFTGMALSADAKDAFRRVRCASARPYRTGRMWPSCSPDFCTEFYARCIFFWSGLLENGQQVVGQ